MAVRRGLTIVGAVDIDPAKAGRDLGEVVGAARKLRVAINPDLRGALKATAPDVVLLCTSSTLKGVAPQIETILKAKKPIVSTTEELAYPWYNQRRLAAAVDTAARRAKVAVLGTGVNPGFVMDALPITLTGVCERVDRITISRIQDARIRRLPFQQKIGSGLTRQQFAAKVRRQTVRHVGLTESIAMIAAAMGWKLDRVTDDIQPKIAEARVSSEFLTVIPVACAASSRTAWATSAGSRGSACTWRPTWVRRSRTTRGDRGRAEPVDEDRRRGARGHRDDIDRGELNPQGAGCPAGAAHDADAADPVLVQSHGSVRPHSVGPGRTLPSDGREATAAARGSTRWVLSVVPTAAAASSSRA